MKLPRARTSARWLVSLSLLLVAAGCRSSAVGPEVGRETREAGARRQEEAGHMEALVIAPRPDGPRGKTFEGALLRQDDGTEWVIDYRKDSPFRVLEGRRVEVEGEPYTPPGQALVGKHLRVASLRVIQPTLDDALIEVHGERQWRGRFEAFTYPAGTKLAGETTRLFRSEQGEQFHLSHTPSEPVLDRSVTVTGYRVEPSRFVARVGGPYLWIVAAE